PGLIVVRGGMTGDVLALLAPLGVGFAGGFNVALGDVNGDGRDDPIVGLGNQSVVGTFDAMSQRLLGVAIPFPEAFGTGVQVGTTDRNTDVVADVVTTPS